MKSLLLLSAGILIVGCKPQASSLSDDYSSAQTTPCQIQVMLPNVSDQGFAEYGKQIQGASKTVSVGSAKGCFDAAKLAIAEDIEARSPKYDHFKNDQQSSANFVYKGVSSMVYSNSSDADWQGEYYNNVRSVDQVQNDPNARDCTLVGYDNTGYFGSKTADTKNNVTLKASNWQSCYKLAYERAQNLQNYQYIYWTFADSYVLPNSGGYVSNKSAVTPQLSTKDYGVRYDPNAKISNTGRFQSGNETNNNNSGGVMNFNDSAKGVWDTYNGKNPTNGMGFQTPN